METAMTVQSYKDLVVWQKAMDLVEMVYRQTRTFPKEELYGLSSQLRRAVVSIPSNIAEGQGRAGPVEFSRFLNIAYGSLLEVETQLLIAKRLQYVNETELNSVLELVSRVGQLINGLLRSLKNTPRSTDHGPRTTDHDSSCFK
jgi:four helix bundle protein